MGAIALKLKALQEEAEDPDAFEELLAENTVRMSHEPSSYNQTEDFDQDDVDPLTL